MLRRSWAIVRIYGLRYAIAVPLACAVIGGALGYVLGPGDLADDEAHDDRAQLFGTAAQLIGALLVALVVEARAPFSRTGTVAARLIAACAALVITAGGLAAVLALDPGLSDTVYRVCFAITWAGLAAGLVAVTLLGISVVTGTLRKVTREDLETLRKLGDPAAAQRLIDEFDDDW